MPASSPKRSHLIPLLILLGTSLTASAMAGSILWDDCHDTNGDELNGNFSLLEDVIEAEGHAIVELDGDPGDITAAALAGYDALWIFDAEAALTDDEIAAIQTFVAGGGGLFIAYDAAAALLSHNLLLAPYDISIDDEGIHADGHEFTMFNGHPVTAALNAIAVDYAFSLTIGPAAIDLIAGGDEDVLAVHGTERVAVFGDTATFADPDADADTDIMQVDNVVLAVNLAEWTTGGGPVTTETRSWSDVKSLFQ